jgi:serine/threonine-protein kinase
MTRFGPFRFDPDNGLWRGTAEVPLPPRALGVLRALLAQPGTVVSKQALMDAVWRDTFVTDTSMLEAIRVLRDRLGDDRLNPTYIQTVHRRGYRFIAPTTTGVDVERHPVVVRQPPPRPMPHDTRAGSPAGEPLIGAEWRPLVVAGSAGVVSLVGIALVFALFGQRPPPPRPTTRFTIALPDDTAIDPLRGSVAVSADGMRMVYVALHAGRPRLFMRTVDRDAPQAIEGSDSAADPFFSPDGNWVGFFAHGSLKKLRVEGGTPVPLCAAHPGAGASWSRDGTIVFGGGPGGGLARVSEAGGEPVLVTAPAPGSREVSYGWPDILPDGSILYTAMSLAGSRVAIFDVATGLSHPLIDAGAFARYSPTGHLVFERRGRLEAAAFALAGARVIAPPRPILRGLATGDLALSGPRFAFSRTGSLIYVPGASADADERLLWLDAQGRLEPLPLPPVAIGPVDVSPDARRVALTVPTDGGADLWVGDTRRGAVSRLAAEGPSVSPAWRPNGLEIAFAYSKAGPFNLFIRPTDYDAAPTPLLESPWNLFPTSWSPDGRQLAFTELHPLTGADVWILEVATRARRQVVRTLFDESHARFSPDGRWLADMSNESGRWDVFVRPAGGHAASERVLVRQGGAVPARHELRVGLEWFTELTRLVRLPA